MVAEELSQVSLLGNPNPNFMQDIDDSDEETLSFCDLPIYSDATSRENLSKNDGSSTFSEQDYNNFEFFSEDWTGKTASSTPKKIIFCGKLIQEPMVDTTNKLENNNETNQCKRRSHLKWNCDSLYQTDNTSTSKVLRREKVRHSTSMSMPDKEKFRCNYEARKLSKNGDVPVPSVSILASPSRSKWHLYVFGLAKFPTEMELRDLRYRQSKRSRARKLRTNRNEGEKGRSWTCLWSLVRALGCGPSSHATAVLKASFGGAQTPCT